MYVVCGGGNSAANLQLCEGCLFIFANLLMPCSAQYLIKLNYALKSKNKGMYCSAVY